MSGGQEHVREHIELAIDRARGNISEHIDELDRELKTKLDFNRMASEHAVQLVAAGAALGFLIGFGVPKVFTRALQLGVPVYLAIRIAKKRFGAAAEDVAELGY